MYENSLQDPEHPLAWQSVEAGSRETGSAPVWLHNESNHPGRDVYLGSYLNV